LAASSKFAFRNSALRSELFANRVRRGCSRAGEKTFTLGKATPRSIIGRDDRDEPASETIGRHPVSEIGCDGTARCAVSLDASARCAGAALEPGGGLHPIDLGLLWIATHHWSALASPPL